MASGSGQTMNKVPEDVGQLPRCCKYTSRGILCSANLISEEGSDPGRAEFGASDLEPASYGGFSGRDDNSLVQIHRFVNAPPPGVHRPVESANYGGHSPARSGRGRGKEHGINKGSGRGQHRGRGRENPGNAGWVTGKAILEPVATGMSENTTANGFEAHGNAVLKRFPNGFASESSCSGRSSARALVEEQKCASEGVFNAEPYSGIVGSRKRGSDWNAMAEGDGQRPLAQNIAGRGAGTDQTERDERFGNVSDRDDSRGELAGFPAVGGRDVPGRDRYEEQKVESFNLPAGRPAAEKGSLRAKAKGKGPEWKMLGIEGDRHGFAGNKGRGRGKGRNAGGRGVGTGQREVDRIDSLARRLVKILRHEAYKFKLSVRSDGYVLVKDLLKLKEKTVGGDLLCTYTIDDVKEAVRKDNKQRFGLVEENGELLIRANQGHSIQAVESDQLLKRISSAEDIPVCVHGTYRRFLNSIFETGLSCMRRRHIHFATGLPKDDGVISGMRGSCDTLIYLDVGKALEDEMKIYLSENGVILTEGFEGIVPSKYFAKVETWPSREPINFQGKWQLNYSAQ